MVQPAGIQNLPVILKQLPELLFLTDIIFYVFGVLFFGSLAMKGFRGSLHFASHFGLRVVMGIISMMGGLALRGLFPFLNEGIYQLFQADLLAGTLVTSIILGVGLYLVSFRLINVTALQKRIEKIQARIQKGKSIPPEQRGWRDPVKLVGIVIIVAILGISLITFRGFPLASQNFLSFLGLTEEDLQNLSKQFEELEKLEGELPPGCESILTILQTTGPDITKLPVSTDSSVKTLLEQEAGSDVLDMRIAVVGGEEYVLAVTKDSQICSATREQFCSCLSVSAF